MNLAKFSDIEDEIKKSVESCQKQFSTDLKTGSYFLVFTVDNKMCCDLVSWAEPENNKGVSNLEDYIY